MEKFLQLRKNNPNFYFCEKQITFVYDQVFVKIGIMIDDCYMNKYLVALTNVAVWKKIN